MAFLTRNVFGDISGKIGNAVVRRRYGKEVIYAKPVNTNISYSDKAVAGRNKFANMVKFARIINSSPDLSAIWKSAKVKGTNGYQKIIKQNAIYTTPEGLTVNNIISPPGLGIYTPSLIVDEDIIEINAELESTNNFSSAILYAFFTSNKVTDSNSFLLSSPASLLGVKKVYGRIKLDENLLKVFSESVKMIVLFTFIFKDSLKKITGWTGSASFILDFADRE
jgi:hypothetical protein